MIIVATGKKGPACVRWATRKKRSCASGQFDTKGVHHLHDGLKPGFGSRRQSLVKTFPPKPGILGDSGHSAGFGYVGKSGQEKVGVVLFKCDALIFRDGLLAVEIDRGMEFRDLFFHGSLQCFCQFSGPGDVPGLRLFVAPAKKDGHRFLPADEIKSVSWTRINPDLQNAIPYRFHVAKTSHRDPVQTSPSERRTSGRSFRFAGEGSCNNCIQTDTKSQPRPKEKMKAIVVRIILGGATLLALAACNPITSLGLGL